MSTPAGLRLSEPRTLALRLRLVRPRADQCLFALVPIWAAVLGAVALERHSTYRTHRFDLGNMVQAVWNTAHGHFLEVTLGDGRQASRLASHADPLLALLAPLWWIWPSARLLLVVQAIALASAAVPIFWLAQKHTGSDGIAFRISLAYLLFPTTLWNAVIDFHAASIAVPLIALGIWFLDNDRLIPFACCAVLAGMAEEHYPLMIGLLGISFAVRRRRYVFASALLGLGAAWSAVDLLVLIPHFNHGPSPFLGRYEAFGSSPADIARTFVVHPVRVLEAATRVDNLKYLAQFAVPMLGLFLAAPLIAFAAAPQLMLNLTSSAVVMHLLPYQYSLGLVAFLFPAVAVGIGRLAPRRRKIASVAIVVLVAVEALLLGPQFGGSRYLFAASPTKARLAAERAAVAMIPPGASVSVTNQIGGHLSARRYIYSFPIMRPARWVVVDSHDLYVGESWSPRIFRRDFANFIQSSRWRLVCESSGVFVFRRREHAFFAPRPNARSATLKATPPPCRR